MTKFFSSFFCAFIFLLAFADTVRAVTRYVSNSGTGCSNGSTNYNPVTNTCSGGTQSTVYTTVQNGANTTLAGDTLIIKAGSYSERVTLNNSGTTGSRITIQGERSGNSYLTRIDGSTPLTGWAAFGSCVGTTGCIYRVARPFIGVCSLNANNLSLQRIANQFMDEGPSGFGIATLAQSTTATRNSNEGITGQFWDGIEAAFGETGGFVYVKFRDGSNPNSKTMTAGTVTPGCGVNDRPTAGSSATFFLNGRSNITIKDLEIRNGGEQVAIIGASNSVILENNDIYGGQRRISIGGNAGQTNEPTGTIIRNNIISNKNAIGIAPGTAGGNVLPGAYTHNDTNKWFIRENMYEVDKYYADPNSQDWSADILIWESNYFEITNNTIGPTPSLGVTIYSSRNGSIINSNTIKNHSASSIYFNHLVGTLNFYDNTWIDNARSIRTNELDTSPPAPYQQKAFYIYRNVFWLPATGGSWLQLGVGPGTADSNVPVFIYHNTMIGGQTGIDLPYMAVGGNSKMILVNNIFQGAPSPVTMASYNCDDSLDVGAWAFNWNYSTTPSCAWSTFSGNSNVTGAAITFSDTTFPGTFAATGSQVGMGLNITRPFTLRGVSYPSGLPGFPVDYGTGNSGIKPNAGLVPTAAPPTTQELVLQISCDNTVVDISGKNNNGTLTNGATYNVAGKYNQACQFDGIDDYISIADAASLDFANAYTLMAWVKPNSTMIDWSEIISKANTSPSDGSYWLSASSSGVCGNGGTAAGFLQAAVQVNACHALGLTAGNWVHMAVTYDGNTVRLYKDATEITQQPATAILSAGTGIVALGSWAGTEEFFAGLIDEVRAYNYALPTGTSTNCVSAPSILRDMNCPINPFPSAATGFKVGSAGGIKIGEGGSIRTGN